MLQGESPLQRRRKSNKRGKSGNIPESKNKNSGKVHVTLSLYRDDCKGRRLTRLYATQGMKSVFSVAKSRAEVMRERERERSPSERSEMQRRLIFAIKR